MHPAALLLGRTLPGILPRRALRSGRLDAVHLATVELLDEPPPLVTRVMRDVRVRDNARAMGYPVA